MCHTGSCSKLWPKQNGRHFVDEISKCIFPQRLFCCFDSNFDEVLSRSRHCFRKWLARNKRQGITWINDKKNHWRIYASLGLNGLMRDEYEHRGSGDWSLHKAPYCLQYDLTKFVSIMTSGTPTALDTRGIWLPNCRGNYQNKKHKTYFVKCTVEYLERTLCIQEAMFHAFHCGKKTSYGANQLYKMTSQNACRCSPWYRCGTCISIIAESVLKVCALRGSWY